MKPFLRLFAAFAALAIAGSILSVTTTAQAAPASADRVSSSASEAQRTSERQLRCYRRCFGAISMSPDQGWGGYYNAPTRSSAIRRAHNRCQNFSNYPGRCRRMGWVRNGCMAVAIKVNANGWITSWATGYGETRRQAQVRAKRRNGGGTIRAWICTAN